MTQIGRRLVDGRHRCHRRHRKGKSLPLIHTDDTDQEINPGDGSCNRFGILVKGRGEGWVKWAAPIWVLHSRQRRPLFQDVRLRRGDCAPRSFIRLPESPTSPTKTLNDEGRRRGASSSTLAQSQSITELVASSWLQTRRRP